MGKKIAEFRGCDHLCIAEVTKDDNELGGGYVTGTPVILCEVASIAKTTEQSSETHYYDNKAAITIRAVGADTVQLVVPAMVLATLAKVTGADIDSETGAYIDRGAANEQKYYALGYRLKLTDGTHRYVWRLKGTFSNVPDEQSNTESNSIDTNNQTVQYTGLDTVHEFQNGGSARAYICDERDGKANLGSFFNGVKTPDNPVTAITAVTALSLSPSTLSVETGSTGTITYAVTPSTAVPEVESSNTSVATVSVSGTTVTVTGEREGTAFVTASAGTKSASTTVTVSDPE